MKSKYIEIPYAILCELTHRCPLSCPYCTNPVELEKKSNEIDTNTWKKIITEASNMGVLQVHFSGGEPTIRKDLGELIRHANLLDLYTNLITSAVLLNEDKIKELYDFGLDHVQVSFQDTNAKSADKIAGYKAHNKKIEICKLIRKIGLPLTINAVMHRQNLHNLEAMIKMAVDLDAERIEVAQVQYYGWALKNVEAFLPSREQLDITTKLVDKYKKKLKGILVFDYVVPDYYARKPKVCLGGWAKRFINITPSGTVLPCHAAESIDYLKFDNIKDKSLSWIWKNSSAFNEFRGSSWMSEPCMSCDRKEIDWGGCRCQAYALTGDPYATDPTCELSPHRKVLDKPLSKVSRKKIPDFVYRKRKVNKRKNIGIGHNSQRILKKIDINQN